MANFTGTLNSNSVYTMLFNAYRLITTIGDNLSGLDASNAEKYKIQGGDFEDQLVWTYVDILKSRVFDPTDDNVLARENTGTISQQVIKVDKVRQIGLTIPQTFLTKQAFMNPSYFDTFNTVVEGQVSTTRKLYDQRKMDTYIGTTESAIGKQTVTLTLPANDDAEKQNRLRALTVGKEVANIFVNLKDSTRDYNDKGYMEAADRSNFTIYWNSDYINEFRYVDLPTVFHKDNIIDNGETLPARYFGTPLTEANYASFSASAPAAGKPIDSDDGTYVPGAGNANGIVRALEELDVVVSGTTTHVFPGDELPTGAKVYDGTKSVGAKVIIPCYVEDAKVICKIIHKDAIKYASVMETETQFWNPKSHINNRYLTWMFGEPDRLAIRPFVTIKAV